MAMLQAILPYYNSPSKTIFFSNNIIKPTTFTKTPFLCLSQIPSNSHFHHHLKHANSNPKSPSSSSLRKVHAIAADDVAAATVGEEEEQKTSEEEEGDVFVGPTSQEEVRGGGHVVDYDWTEEWYPLYLTKDVPEDAPLGLTVFHKQLVLFRDASGQFRCYEDRCPHRLAKLSEGQLVDGRLECLYHGWQFEGEGKCVKIPQLPAGAKIPKQACTRTYEVRDSQGVLWVWMSQRTPPIARKIQWFENFARPGFQDISSTREPHGSCPCPNLP